jgi:homoserine acetyltransferase
MAMASGIPFSPTMDLVLYGHCSSEMAALALFHKKFNLGVQISELKPNSMPQVTDLLVDKLAQQSLADFFLGMKGRMDANSYIFVCKSLMRSVFDRAADRRDIPRFVQGVINGVGLQIQILTLLGFLQEALTLAERTANREEIANIGRAAREIGNRRIEGLCARMLSS